MHLCGPNVFFNMCTKTPQREFLVNIWLKICSRHSLRLSHNLLFSIKERIFANNIRKCKFWKYLEENLWLPLSPISLSFLSKQVGEPPASHHQKHPRISFHNYSIIPKLTISSFSDPLPCGPFLIIHVLPVPHPQRQTLEQRPLAALTNVNVHVEVHMCVKICANICVQISANFCIIRVQIFAHFCIVYLQPYMCISTELLQMRLHLYVTSYLTKCDGSLPPLLQIWGPNCPSTSESSAEPSTYRLDGWSPAQLTDWVIN